MSDTTVKTLSDHSSELSFLVHPKKNLVLDIVNHLGGIEVFNVVAGALMNGGTLMTFCSFKTEHRVVRLFNDHKLELVSLLVESAKSSNHSVYDYLYNLCSPSISNYNEIVKCYDLIAADDLHTETDQKTLKLISSMIHYITVDMVTRIITDYNKHHYIVF